MSSRLVTEIAGLKLTNPVMLAAGILGLSGALLRRIAEAGAGAVVTKSVGSKLRTGYPNPTVVQVGCGLLNAMGLPSPGIHNFGEEIKEAKKGGVPIIVSVYGFSPSNFAEVARAAVEEGADALELNVSCPHVEKTGSEIGQSPRLVAEVVKEVKNQVEKPVFVKLTPNVAEIGVLAEAAVKAGADAVTAINTVKAMTIDIETAQPVLANRIGGLSGPAVKPIAVRCVYDIHRRVEIPVVGCGGIARWQDAVEFMLAGASAVQVGTAVAFEGLGVFKSIAKGIETYLEERGFGSVKEIVGLSQRH
ncbi:dihydroorotate dehydrogenase [Candidatus Bathyarchaeota archaeon]|nr:dihydroorotate dehydrogenase [Candidatus Bathyarchaeota archaeon]